MKKWRRNLRSFSCDLIFNYDLLDLICISRQRGRPKVELEKFQTVIKDIKKIFAGSFVMWRIIIVLKEKKYFLNNIQNSEWGEEMWRCEMNRRASCRCVWQRSRTSPLMMSNCCDCLRYFFIIKFSSSSVYDALLVANNPFEVNSSSSFDVSLYFDELMTFLYDIVIPTHVIFVFNEDDSSSQAEIAGCLLATIQQKVRASCSI